MTQADLHLDGAREENFILESQMRIDVLFEFPHRGICDPESSAFSGRGGEVVCKDVELFQIHGAFHVIIYQSGL